MGDADASVHGSRFAAGPPASAPGELADGDVVGDGGIEPPTPCL